MNMFVSATWTEVSIVTLASIKVPPEIIADVSSEPPVYGFVRASS